MQPLKNRIAVVAGTTPGRPETIEETAALVSGRAVVALAAHPGVHQKAGKAFASWTRAKEYGFERLAALIRDYERRGRP